MAERPGNKNLKHFKPGQSGNPSGRRKGNITKNEVEDLVSRCFTMTKAELKEIIESPKSRIIDIHVASIIAQGIKKGDLYSLNGLLDRTIGKVKDVVENHNHSHDEAFDDAPRGELIDLLRKRSNDK